VADLFISYASEDRDRVRPLAEALKARGFSVWWDRALVAGDEYATVIARELEAAKVVVAVWTKASALSHFVRDEAERARAAGRLAPVLFDRGVTPPIGFGGVQAEDFTRWSGGASAPEIAILEESLRARLEGRAPDDVRIQQHRRRLAARMRGAALAVIVAGIAVIGGGAFYVATQFGPAATGAPTRQEQIATLLDLVQRGRISGEQALEFARLLEEDAFGAATGGAGDLSRAAFGGAPPVPGADAVAAARASFTDAAATLLQDPDPRVRTALLETRSPDTRKAGLDAMWKIAREGGASAAPIWRACGALMLATGDERAARALENARTLNPQDKALWRMLSYANARQQNTDAAAGASFVAAGLDAASRSDWTVAGAEFDRALAFVGDAQSRGFLLGQMGDAAAATGDWRTAETRYLDALTVHGEQKNLAAVSMDSSKLARTQMKQGALARACSTLENARAAGAAVTEEELAGACAGARVRAPG
jgi:hypothetical protein